MRSYLTLLYASALAVSVFVSRDALVAQQPSNADAVERVDYLTFAQGAMPIDIGGAGAKLGADFEAAVRITDGDPTGFTVISQAPDDAETVFTYELPALTTFDRFAVPEIRETPSPVATFTRRVEVHGSATSATDGYVLLASATLETHRARGMVTELEMHAEKPVRWVRVRLVGGINVMRPLSSFEFSEIIGNGTQEVPQVATHFNGAWRTMGQALRLEQDGPVVSGCYDRLGKLTGTVTGNVLRAMGVNDANVPSAFIVAIAADGSAAAGTCEKPAVPSLGCGSIIHGITFAFDSAEIRPDSEPVLAELYKGLASDTSAAIVIEGHTSSEGSDAYNQRLSERRAQAVVANLVVRGLAKNRVSAAGLGESRPIASNADESGRSLNRRVEVHCR